MVPALVWTVWKIIHDRLTNSSITGLTNSTSSQYNKYSPIVLQIYLTVWQVVHSYFFLICLILYISVNSYGHVKTVWVHQPHFFLGKLDKAVNQYFMHILSLATDNPSWIKRKKKNDRRNYFMTIISMKVLMGSARIELPSAGSALRLTTDCANRLLYGA